MGAAIEADLVKQLDDEKVADVKSLEDIAGFRTELEARATKAEAETEALKTHLAESAGKQEASTADVAAEACVTEPETQLKKHSQGLQDTMDMGTNTEADPVRLRENTTGIATELEACVTKADAEAGRHEAAVSSAESQLAVAEAECIALREQLEAQHKATLAGSTSKQEVSESGQRHLLNHEQLVQQLVAETSFIRKSSSGALFIDTFPSPEQIEEAQQESVAGAPPNDLSMLLDAHTRSVVVAGVIQKLKMRGVAMAL